MSLKEESKEVLGGLWLWLLVIVFIALVGFGLQGVGLVNLKFWGVKYQDARREIFTHNRSYRESRIQDLARYKLEYERSSDTTEKEAIANMIRQYFAESEIEMFPYQLQVFLREIRSY